MRLPLPSVRRVLFRLHWVIGLTAGFVLSLMGATGALMSYEEAIIAIANSDRSVVEVGNRHPLEPGALIARIREQDHDSRVSSLTLSTEPGRSVSARFERDPSTGVRPASRYIDPYSGSSLGQIRLEGFFGTVRSLHRWLLIPGDAKGWGRTITGFCAVSLLVLLTTGLFLRWPKVHRWRTWLKPSLSRPGRSRWWSLHAVAGTWLTPVYLVIAMSGLTWSFDSVKQGATWLLTGQASDGAEARSGRIKATGGAAQHPLRGDATAAIDRAWAAFLADKGHLAARAVLTLPGRDANAIRIRWYAKDVRQEERNEATFDLRTGDPLFAARSADKSLGQRLSDNMLEVHRGRLFGDVFAFLFFLAAAAMPCFAATGVTLYVLRRSSRRRHIAPAAAQAAELPRLLSREAPRTAEQP